MKVSQWKGNIERAIRGDGGRYDQGSAYAIRINREVIHKKDRGRGSAMKGERKEGGQKERRGKGGGA